MDRIWLAISGCDLLLCEVTCRVCSDGLSLPWCVTCVSPSRVSVRVWVAWGFVGLGRITGLRARQRHTP